ncbi:MAG: regulatory protein RecX [Eubacteriales bacterium]|nr:regulatory protein RecX [Eubacteriales bacterium]
MDVEKSEAFHRARKKAMDLLMYRDRSEKELGERLQKAGFTQEEREDALKYVRKFGYLEDRRFAFNYIYSRSANTSRQKLFMELRQKGVPQEIVQKAWEEYAEEYMVDERKILKKAIQKKAEPGSKLDAKKMRSLMGYLGRRGFQYEDIRNVLSELDITMEESGKGF